MRAHAAFVTSPCILSSTRITPAPSQAAALPTILLELPVAVVKRADLTSLEPARDAVEVEGVLHTGVSTTHRVVLGR